MTVLVGHRGACGHAPENTLVSLRRARGFGLEWVEFDVRVTSDGIPVLLHDETLDRTTDASGPLVDRSAASLAGVDAGSWFSAAFRGEAVPTLEEAVRWLVDAGMQANIEIKPAPGLEAATASATRRVLERRWPGSRPPPLISSFSPACLSAVRDAAPDLPRALLFGDVPPDWLRQLRELGCEALHCHHRAAVPELVRAVRGEGFACRVYTVNDPERGAELSAQGVDAIVTDYPDRLGAAVG